MNRLLTFSASFFNFYFMCIASYGTISWYHHPLSFLQYFQWSGFQYCAMFRYVSDDMVFKINSVGSCSIMAHNCTPTRLTRQEIQLKQHLHCGFSIAQISYRLEHDNKNSDTITKTVLNAQHMISKMVLVSNVPFRILSFRRARLVSWRFLRRYFFWGSFDAVVVGWNTVDIVKQIRQKEKGSPVFSLIVHVFLHISYRVMYQFCERWYWKNATAAARSRGWSGENELSCCRVKALGKPARKKKHG